MRTATAEQSWEKLMGLLATERGPLVLVIYGLETTNMAFITLIQALCQQSFGLTLPQNCVRVRGPQKAQIKV